MTLTKNYKQTLISTLIIALLTSFGFMAAKPYGAPIENWWLVLCYVSTLLIAIVAGIILIILRLTKVLKQTTRFFYNFIGILNLYLGFTSLAYIVATQPNTFDNIWIGVFTTSFLIGLYIIIDVYKKVRKPTLNN